MDEEAALVKEVKMKILVFGMTENPGGVESVIMNIYRHIDRSKFQLDFLCNTKTVAHSDEIERLGGKIYRIPMRSESFFQYRKALNGFFQEHGKEYDAIWVNVCSLANVDYLKAARKAGISRRIIHSHNSENMDSRLRGILHQRNKKKIADLATDYWACSMDAARWFYPGQLIKNPAFSLVTNGIDPLPFKPDPAIRQRVRQELQAGNKKIYGNVGRLHFQKNQSFLLDIYSEIAKEQPESELWLVGQGEDLDTLKDKTRQLKLEDKVRFLGVRSDVPELLQAMDVFLFPSVFEGLGLALVEAQAAGLPCYASRNVIPAEAKVTDLVEFLPLDWSAKQWADRIVACSISRTDNPGYEQVVRSEFNMNSQIEKIESLFLKPDTDTKQ